MSFSLLTSFHSNQRINSIKFLKFPFFREDCLEEILETYYKIFCESLEVNFSYLLVFFPSMASRWTRTDSEPYWKIMDSIILQIIFNENKNKNHDTSFVSLAPSGPTKLNLILIKFQIKLVSAERRPNPIWELGFP